MEIVGWSSRDINGSDRLMVFSPLRSMNILHPMDTAGPMAAGYPIDLPVLSLPKHCSGI
jgi:hypothetical protein